tara:strand:+ start:79 stop:591 length:513 start_codon:yes stop_codon:yes gene_type:complete
MKKLMTEWRKRLSEQTKKELKITNTKELIAALENYGRSKGGFASDAARKAFIRTIVGSLRDEAKKGSPVFPIFSTKLNQMIQTVENTIGVNKLYKSEGGAKGKGAGAGPVKPPAYKCKVQPRNREEAQQMYATYLRASEGAREPIFDQYCIAGKKRETVQFENGVQLILK